MRALFGMSLLLLIALSGCLGGDGEVEPEDDTETAEDAGSVMGQILNKNSLDPVADARIRLILEDEVTHEVHTRSNGNYTVANVAPNTYRIQVFAPQCCETELDRFTVGPYETVTKSFMLDPIVITEGGDPWVSDTMDSSGLISCSLTTPSQPIYPCQPYDEEHSLEAGHTVEHPGLKTLHAGLKWDATTGADQLTLSVYINVQESKLIAQVTETSPIEIRVDSSGIEDEDLRFENFYDGDMPLRFAVTPADVGVIYQQQFTIHWTLHYWEEAPSGFSTIPDN